MLWPWGTTGMSPAVPRDVAPRLRCVCPKQTERDLVRVQLPHGLVVQLSLFLHLRSTCTGKAWHPSGSDESHASSVCAQSLLPLGTRFSAHSGPHTRGVCVCTCVYVCIHVHRYRYVHVHSCVIAATLAMQVSALSLNEQLPCCTESGLGRRLVPGGQR